jgi:hypothetical protein
MERTKPGLHETTSSLPSEPIAATTEWLTSDQDGSTAPDKPSIGFRGTESGQSPVRTRPDDKTAFFFSLIPPKNQADLAFVPGFNRARNRHAGLITSVVASPA